MFRSRPRRLPVLAPTAPFRNAACAVLIACVATTGATFAAAQARIVDIRCEHRVDPIGIDNPTPRFSWQIDDARRGARQTAYSITVSDFDGRTVWRSGRVSSDRSTSVPYGGPPLTSRQRYFWNVRLWDQDENPSFFSRFGTFEMGILNASEWKAQWIGISKPACLLRKAFRLNRTVRRATVYATARGVYRLRLNGQRVSRDELAPGWTDYRVRHIYQAYDVTKMLRVGENAIGAHLGRGWFGSRLGWRSTTGYIYGAGPNRLFVQMHIEFTDRSTAVIVSDGTWRAADGPVVDSTLYDGETYDARKEQPGWDRSGFDDRSWASVSAINISTVLTAERTQPQRVTESIMPKSVTNPASGVYVFDLGKNIVGWVRLRIRGSAGRSVQLRHAEVLQPNGMIDTYNLRTAKSVDVYTLKGGNTDEFFEPRFTYHGFRYVEVTGYTGRPTVNDLVGQVVHTDAPVTGAFNCSLPLINDIFDASLLGQRGNFSSVPTDCPQRDERLGWTGDAHAYWRSACYNQDLSTYSAKWARDIREAQATTGSFVDISPEIPGLRPARGAPFWGNAGVAIPWIAYRHYGDEQIIREHYPAIQKWLAYLKRENPNFAWLNSLGNNYGDWLAPSGNPAADRPLIATAMWALDLKRASLMAAAIGNQNDSLAYATDFDSVKNAFIQRYVRSNGVVGSGNQTPQLLALEIGLLPNNLVAAAVQKLVSDISGRGDHLSTGFVGTRYLLPVLADNGQLNLAYRLLAQTTKPSWGHKILRGATTMWERWDNYDWCRQRRDSLCSFNHYALGSVSERLYRYLAGIDLHPTVAGFKRFVVRPRIDRQAAAAQGITEVKASYEAISGTIESHWKLADSDLTLNVTVPPNTVAEIHVPTRHVLSVFESGRVFTDSPGLRYIDYDGTAAIIEAGAGQYAFRVGGLSVADDLRVGKQTKIYLSQRNRARSNYQLLMALSNNRGILIPGAGRVPVDADLLFFLTIYRLLPTVTANFYGALDANGNAAGTLALPPDPALVGYPLHFAGVTYGERVTYISNGVNHRIKP